MPSLVSLGLAAFASVAGGPEPHAADQAKQPPIYIPPPERMRPITYPLVDVSNPQVRAAASFAARSVSAQLRTVTEARALYVLDSAVYKLSFTTTDGRAWNAEVNADAPDEFRVVSMTPAGGR